MSRRTTTAIVVALVAMVAMLVVPVPASAEERPMLRLGSTGEAVATLEQRLVDLGYNLDTIDTRFEQDTKTAVITLQTTARIARDGIVGPITWAAIDANTTAPTQPTPTPQPNPDPQPAPAPKPDLLRQGSTGPAVLALEQRLADLGYWLDDVDETFDALTHHAVVALQKAAGIGRDGVVGPVTREALDRGVRPTATTADGHVIEVDLGSQLLLVVDDGVVTEIHDTSTGRRAGSTPIGTWTIEREIDGYRHAPLGTLYRPKYFHRGVAIHGYPSVPARPASHGCVRVTYRSMDHLWAAGLAPLETAVEVHS